MNSLTDKNSDISNNIARLLPTSSPKKFIANERDEIRNETKLFLGNAPAFIFLLSFTIPPRKERAERERERERETIFGSEGGVIIAQTHRTRREFMDLVITSSPKFSFLSLSLSLSLSLYPERTFARTQRYKKKTPSLSLFLLAQTVSLNHISIYHGIDDMLCIVIIAISAGSRVLARVFRARKTRIPRAQSLFFCISFTGNVWLNLVLYADIFLCNHKHIQSFVNSVLIIAKTLSLSLLLSRARLVSRHRRKREREREKERKRKRDIQY